MGNYSIRAENLGKQYRVYRENSRRRIMLRQVIQDGLASNWKSFRSMFRPRSSNKKQRPDSAFWALRDITFEINSGESVGIIGRNGAGKSTLLKILSRVTAPSHGRVYINGKVGSLLEVGTGFHSELTGRENVYLNGSILGMSRQEIDRKFDEIVDFSEVENFLDTPVKFYSSGMKMRLAFSVAAHLEPEILLVDEVLAVGDTAFQKKSLAKMEGVLKDGRTILFVSHNLSIVRSLCKKGLYLEKGKMKYFGDMNKAIGSYLNSGDAQPQMDFRAEAKPNLRAQILQVGFKKTNVESNLFPHDHSITAIIKVAIHKPLYRTSFSLSVMDDKQSLLLTSYDFEQNEHFLQSRVPGAYSYNITIPPILAPGQYRLTIQAHQLKRRKMHLLDSVENICPFEVYDNSSARSRANLQWQSPLSIPIKWMLHEETTSKFTKKARNNDQKTFS